MAAEHKLESILTAEPNNASARVMLGVIYAKTRRFLLATSTLESVLQEYPEQFDSLIWLAVAKKALNEFEEAIALCQKAIELNPKDPTAYNTLGLCYLSSRKTDLALSAFGQAIKLAPEGLPSRITTSGWHFDSGTIPMKRASISEGDRSGSNSRKGTTFSFTVSICLSPLFTTRSSTLKRGIAEFRPPLLFKMLWR